MSAQPVASRWGVGWPNEWLRRQARTLLAWSLLVALFLLTTALSETFRSPAVVLETFKGATFVSMAAAAEFFVVVTGGIDLSIGSVATISGMAAAVGHRTRRRRDQWPVGDVGEDHAVRRDLRHALRPAGPCLYLQRQPGRSGGAHVLRPLRGLNRRCAGPASADGGVLGDLLVCSKADSLRQASVRRGWRQRGGPPSRCPHHPSQL